MEQKLNKLAVENNTSSGEYSSLTESNTKAMNLYLILIIAFTIAMAVRAATFLQYFALASLRLHRTAFSNLVNASISFFDRHLSGNIVNRLTRDLGIVDELIPYTAYGCTDVKKKSDSDSST